MDLNAWKLKYNTVEYMPVNGFMSALLERIIIKYNTYFWNKKENTLFSEKKNGGVKAGLCKILTFLWKKFDKLLKKEKLFDIITVYNIIYKR